MSLAYLVGVMLGDGGVYGNTYTVFCRDGDKRFVQWCAERVREIFGIQPRIHKAAPNCWAVSTNRAEIHQFMCKLGYPKGRKSTAARIPEIFLRSRSDRIDVVKGLFDAEGYCGIDRQKHGNKVYRYPYVGIDMIAKPVIKEVRKILGELGISCSLQVKKPRAWGKNPQWSLVVKGHGGVAEFEKKVGFRHPAKSARLEELVEGGSSETIRWAP